MKIDRKLNIIIEMDRGEGSKLFVHAAPVSREVFDAHWQMIAKAYGAIMNSDMAGFATRVAMRMIRQVAEDSGTNADALADEIRLRATVVLQNGGKWDTIPLQQAVSGGMLDEEEAAEVDNNIAFFTCCWHMTPRAQRTEFLTGLARRWGVQTSSSDSTAWANSLRMSTATGSSGPSQTATP